jgi:hypothetical protein
MKAPTRRHFALLLSVAAIGIACGEGTGLVEPHESASVADELPLTMLQRWRRADRGSVPVLRRTIPLRQSYTSAATIGPDGGEITLAGAGLTIRVPAGALLDRTTIAVTARAGRDVAYDFSPHGLVFRQPVVVTQELWMTSARTSRAVRESLEAAYYEDPKTAFADDGLATITERGPVLISADRRAAIFVIGHFSGYLVASGYKDPVPPQNR